MDAHGQTGIWNEKSYLRSHGFERTVGCRLFDGPSDDG